MDKNTEILVTGAAGLTGNYIVKKLVENGYNNVTALLHKKIPTYTFPSVNYVFSDLKNYENCSLYTKNRDVVIMASAVIFGAERMQNNPMAIMNENVIMYTQLLECCYKNKIKKLITFGTTTSYPESNDYAIKEEDMWKGDPIDKYYCPGWMKRFLEVLCVMYSQKLKDGFETLVFRPTNIYGPGDKFELDKCHVLPALIRKAVEKMNPFEVWGDGSEIRDFIYAEDVADIVVKSLDFKSINKFEAFNLGSGEIYSVKDVLNIILKILEFDANIVFNRNKPTMINKRIANIDKIKNVLGFKPITPIESGIKNTIEWYKSQLTSQS